MSKISIKVSIDTFLDTYHHHPMFFDEVINDLTKELNYNDTVVVITQQKNINGKLVPGKIKSFDNPDQFKEWVNKFIRK